MKKLLVIFTALLSVCAFADVPPRASIDMMINMAQQSDDFYAVADCLGISKEDFLKNYRSTVDDCYDDRKVRQAEDFMKAFEACIKPHMLQRLGRTEAQADACSTEEPALDEIDHEMDALMDRIGDDGPTAEQRQRMDELSKAKMAQQEQELAKTMRMISKASQGRLKDITLPIYKNSQVVMHAADMGMDKQGVKPLPAATFASSDTPEKVLAFYKQQLPNFKYKKLSGGEHILMETLPANFAILSHMGSYYSTPHVLIRAEKGQPGLTPANTKSFIEIAYRR